MGKVGGPRKGSLQVWPRKRAKRIYSRIRSWAIGKESKPMGFAGYKVGMGHVSYTEERSTSPVKGRTVVVPVTILECPPVKVAAIAYYKKTAYGLKKITEVRAVSSDKHFIRKLIPTKSVKSKAPDEFADVRLVVHTQPALTTIGKKQQKRKTC